MLLMFELDFPTFTLCASRCLALSFPLPFLFTDKRDHALSEKRKVVVNRPLPFSGNYAWVPQEGSAFHCRRRRRHSADRGAEVIRAQPYALQSFRFHCRLGQLQLAEQLALANVWMGDMWEMECSPRDTDRSAGFGVRRGEKLDGVSGEALGRKATRGGLRVASMTAKLNPSLRSALGARQKRIRRALEDLRRLAGPCGSISTIPKIMVDTRGGAESGWGIPGLPSQRNVVRGKSIEKMY